jgi:hypothetical protein
VSVPSRANELVVDLRERTMRWLRICGAHRRFADDLRKRTTATVTFVRELIGLYGHSALPIWRRSSGLSPAAAAAIPHR